MREKISNEELVPLSRVIVAAADRFDEIKHTLGEWMSDIFGVKMSTSQWKTYIERAKKFAPYLRESEQEEAVNAKGNTADLETEIQKARQENGLPNVDISSRTPVSSEPPLTIDTGGSTSGVHRGPCTPMQPDGQGDGNEGGDEQ